MVVEKASGRVPGRAPRSSRSCNNDDGGLQYVSRKSDPSFRFFPSRGIYRRKGSVRRWASWPHPWWRGPGVGRATLGCGWLLAPLCLIFGLRDASGKIEGLAFVSSNSENISCVAFLKHKTAENRELALWHLVSRLVPENA
jgi:hypothetical protein